MIVVPGDVLTYHARFSLELKGTGLRAKLFTSNVGLAGDSPLLTELNPATVVKMGAVQIPVGADGIIVGTTDNGKFVDVAIQFTFDKDAATNLSMDQAVQLANFTVNLVQQTT